MQYHDITLKLLSPFSSKINLILIFGLTANELFFNIFSPNFYEKKSPIDLKCSMNCNTLDSLLNKYWG